MKWAAASSLGRPIGCTGSRQMVPLMHQMQRKDYSTGLVSMCIDGGMRMAMIVERSSPSMMTPRQVMGMEKVGKTKIKIPPRYINYQ